MTGADALDIARDAIWVTVEIAAPTMLVGLVIGLTVALFQALTQIQEMTIAFVPKILAIFIVLILALPFMSDALNGFMLRISERIVAG
ncbi:flagellar biosynthesis protein FliQ [Chthonobacter rhizosphaerae]|uniref:flagellar biosynthesis protein FliQ n=1 Tax=Chthonobacter rhizosphaerae TaxID=2735553 RepID=UPI0015EFC44B|nr:flagellar biosynthesis protein FliQ [Chthonobacter rhizosphaerae]